MRLVQGSVVAKGECSTLPLLCQNFQFGNALLQTLYVVDLPLPGVTCSKGIPSTLQSHFVAGVDSYWRERTFAPTGLDAGHGRVTLERKR